MGCKHWIIIIAEQLINIAQDAWKKLPNSLEKKLALAYETNVQTVCLSIILIIKQAICSATQNKTKAHTEYVNARKKFL